MSKSRPPVTGVASTSRTSTGRPMKVSWKSALRSQHHTWRVKPA